MLESIRDRIINANKTLRSRVVSKSTPTMAEVEQAMLVLDACESIIDCIDGRLVFCDECCKLIGRFGDVEPSDGSSGDYVELVTTNGSDCVLCMDCGMELRRAEKEDEAVERYLYEERWKSI